MMRILPKLSLDIPCKALAVVFPCTIALTVPLPLHAQQEHEADAVATIPPPEEQLGDFTLAPGYEVNLYASEADSPLFNPTGMAFDADGKLWVITSPTYPHLLPGKTPEDKLLYYEDTNGDGVADKHTVFLDNLLIPTGFALDTNGVYLAQQPNIWFVRDTDGDGVGDRKEVVLQGFSVEDSHHSTSAFTWGPDGAFYFHEGIFLHSQVETPYGPRRSHDGAVSRFKPSTQRLDVMSHRSYYNPWGMAFDRWGQSIVSDASDGNHYNFAAVIAAFDYPDKIIPPEPLFKRGRPMAGNVIVSSRHFPDDVQGTHLNNQSIGFLGTRWDRLTAQESGWRTEALPDLIQSTSSSFRPVAAAFGPDGALYILDFCNPETGHMRFSRTDENRDYSHGRIWRITAKGRPLLKMPKIRGESPQRHLELLREPEDHVRHWARRHLQTGAEEVVMPALEQWLANLDPADPDHAHLVTEALWIHAGRDVINKPLLDRALALEEPLARAAAVRVIRHWLQADALTADEGIKLLAKHVVDADPRVRLEALTAAGFVKSPDASELAVFASTMPLDRDMYSALRQTLKTLEKYGPPTSVLGRSFLLRIFSVEELLAQPMDPLVAEAILRRSDLPREKKEDALAWMMQEKERSRARVLVDAIGNLKADESGAVETLRPMLLETDPADLAAHLLQLTQFASSAPTKEILHLVLAGLTMAEGNLDAAVASGQPVLDLYQALLLIDDPKTLNACHEHLRDAMLMHQNDETRRAAYFAIAHIPRDRASTLELLAENILDEAHRPERRFAAIEALNTIPESEWPEALQPFVLRQVTIRAVQGALLYDTREVTARAGQPLKITFANPDAVDHNLVLGKPGSLERIGLAAAAMIAHPGGDTSQQEQQDYIPDLPEVIGGTPVISTGASAILTVFAPREPGDYVYLCTYPGHFGTMNGILKVVPE